jgi:DNA polymerase III alpha subunit (gram-positive type)
MSTEEIYVSTDIESDGPLPGLNSMLSFGSAAFRENGEMVGVFSANLELLPGATPDPKTMSEFWDKNPEAWAACRKDLQPIEPTMQAYSKWIRDLPGKPVFVGYPATFDHPFIHHYLIRFTGDNPMSFSGLDMKSYAMAKLGTTFRGTSKKTMPKSWFGPSKHTHVAIDDAIEQGQLFLAMLKYLQAR